MAWQWVKDLLGFDGHQYGRYYVYELVDARFEGGRVFYVGKGTEGRMYQHEKDARRLLGQGRRGVMRLQPKHKRIIEIWDDGYKVEYRVVFRTDDEEEAYQAESKRIDHYGLEHLTNETYGYRPKASRTRVRVAVVY